jgi:hypothetical protein
VRLEGLLADSSCSIAYVFSEMKIEGVWWSWDTWSSCANRRQERVHQLLRHCSVLAKPFLHLVERKFGACDVCKNSCLVHEEFVLSQLFSSYCHMFQLLKTGFGLVIGFIKHLLVVTTNKYTTVTHFHTTNHSTLIFLVYFHWSSLSVSWQRIYNTFAVDKSSNY